MNSRTGSGMRPAAVAGMFYPGEKAELERELDNLFHEVPAHAAASHGALFALIVPHAGYMYSGFTAASAYALVEGRAFDTCILVGPSHQDYFRGVSVYPGSGYATPLGECAIDDACRQELVKQAPEILRQAVDGHRTEHSLEVQLPFLQRVLPDAKIVPLVMGDQEAGTCRALGEAIARTAAGKNILLVASSDLSHFYPSHVARAKDREVIGLIEAFNVSGLLQQLEADTLEACGGGPIAAVMTAAERSGAARATIVHACNSGDMTGDHSRVVGYCSAALWKTP